MLGGSAVGVRSAEFGNAEDRRRVEQGAGAIRDRGESIELQLQLTIEPALDADAIACRNGGGDAVTGFLERAVLRVREAMVARAGVLDVWQEIVAIVGEPAAVD